MKNKYIALLMTVSLSLLSACGGGSSTTASTTPATDYSAIWQAIIDHPDQQRIKSMQARVKQDQAAVKAERARQKIRAGQAQLAKI